MLATPSTDPAGRPARVAAVTSEALLRVRGLRTVLRSGAAGGGGVPVVDGVDLAVDRGETLALVGESGCGKSVAALSLLDLVPDPPLRITAGEVLLDGRDLLSMQESDLQGVRGRLVGMVFQEPSASFNPVLRVGRQVGESLRWHRGMGRREADRAAVGLLDRVGVPDAGRVAGRYPHEFSGGMLQRAAIAAALACGPDLLIADEPTTALDVTVQAQILELLASLQEETGMGVLLITHDLGVVAEAADRVSVMYGGRIVEEAPVEGLFETPAHPYARGLLASLPGDEGAAPRPIPGAVPEPADVIPGCRFSPRCGDAFERCSEEPPLSPRGEGRRAACWLEEGP